MANEREINISANVASAIADIGNVAEKLESLYKQSRSLSKSLKDGWTEAGAGVTSVYIALQKVWSTMDSSAQHQERMEALKNLVSLYDTTARQLVVTLQANSQELIGMGKAADAAAGAVAKLFGAGDKFALFKEGLSAAGQQLGGMVMDSLQGLFGMGADAGAFLKGLGLEEKLALVKEEFGKIGRESDMAGNVEKLKAFGAGNDPYTQEFEGWKEERFSSLVESGAAMAEWDAAFKEEEIRREEMQHQRKLAMATASMGLMANVASAMYAASDGKSKTAFRLMQAMRIGETLMNTHSAAMGAYNALAGIQIIGPALGAAAAAAAIAYGMMQVRSIASMKPGGGASASVSAPSAASVSAGSAGSGPAAVLAQEGKADKESSQVVNVHIYGNVIDQDKFSRELIPSITKALSDGVQ